MQIRIPRTHIEMFKAIRDRVGEQLRARGVGPITDSLVFAEMISLLDTAVPPTPLPGTYTPSAIMAAITRTLDIAGKAMETTDKLDALFRTMFPAEYAASALGNPEPEGDETPVDETPAADEAPPRRRLRVPDDWPPNDDPIFDGLPSRRQRADAALGRKIDGLGKKMDALADALVGANK